MKNRLIELLVVVLIIGILAAIALPQYQKAVEKTRLSEAFILGKHIQLAEEIYCMANGSYTSNFEELALDIPSGYQINPRSNYELKPTDGYKRFFSLDSNRVIFYYYSKTDTVDLAIFFWHNDRNIHQSNRGKIKCHSYTDHGQKLCATLPL